MWRSSGRFLDCAGAKIVDAMEKAADVQRAKRARRDSNAGSRGQALCDVVIISQLEPSPKHGDRKSLLRGANEARLQVCPCTLWDAVQLTVSLRCKVQLCILND